MKYLFFLLQLISAVANAQPGYELLSFKKHAVKIFKKADSTAYQNRMIKDGLTTNYLIPLANDFSNKKFLINHYSKDRYYDNLSQTLSFTGDYKAVLRNLRFGYQMMDAGMLASIKKKSKVTEEHIW